MPAKTRGLAWPDKLCFDCSYGKIDEAIAKAVKYDIMEKPKKAVPRMPICMVLGGMGKSVSSLTEGEKAFMTSLLG